MKKRILSALIVLVMVLLSLSVVACSGAQMPNKAYASINNADDYNKNLYYLNELKFEIADPSVIYIEEGDQKGYFYAYGTSDLVGCFGIQCWRSKDLTNWEYVSVAYQPNFDTTWGFSNNWAPEVIYDEGMYWMFYNADWNAKGSERKYISVAISENPQGPFVCVEEEVPAFDFTSANPEITNRDPSLARNESIDAHPFIDPVSGERYLYYSGYSHGSNQTIFGVKMIDWLHPDYSTLVELTHLFYTTTDDTEEIFEGQGWDTVNEGPFIWYQDGTYFMTFSVFSWPRPQYQVRQAVSTSPLGNYTKIQPEDGGAVIVSDMAWNTNASVGHNCFIKCGDKLMMAYHTFRNRSDISDGRALAVDTISFVENTKGQMVMHCNGPTYAYQPLPAEISGYQNVAKLANVEATNAVDEDDIPLLTDETIKIHETDMVKELEVTGGKTKLTFTFDNFVNIRSILVYNSSDYTKCFDKVSSIELQYKKGQNGTGTTKLTNIPFDSEWGYDEYSEFMNPGTSSIVEFDEIPVNKVTITLEGKFDDLALNEVMILGKVVNNPTGVQKFSDSYSFSNPDPVEAIPVYESLTFGSAGTHVSNFGYDLTHDDGTENRYVDKVWCGNSQLLFFKGISSTSVYVEAYISVLDHRANYMGDMWPKIGLVLKNNTNNSNYSYFAFFNIDCTANFNGQNVGWVESNAAGTDYLWDYYAEQSTYVPGIKYTGNNYTKLAFARIGNHCWMFVNDTLVFDLPDGALMGFTNDQRTACSPAFLTYNTFARFANYSATGDLQQVKERLAQLGVKV